MDLFGMKIEFHYCSTFSLFVFICCFFVIPTLVIAIVNGPISDISCLLMFGHGYNNTLDIFPTPIIVIT
jgi:hypothetical protein